MKKAASKFTKPSTAKVRFNPWEPPSGRKRKKANRQSALREIALTQDEAGV